MAYTQSSDKINVFNSKPQAAVSEAQVFITRRCNLYCGYCNLTRRAFEKELDAEQWKIAIGNMEKLGIKALKILGGEPTARDDLEEIIRFLNSRTKIRYAILSNSTFDERRLESLVDAGIMGYFASIDGIDDVKSIDSHAGEKSKKGFEKLLKLREKGVKILGANIVISKKNLKEIPDVVKILSDEGIYSNISPVIYGKGNWEFRIDIPQEFKFIKEDITEIDNAMEKLLQMKREGYKIAVPDSYLKSMSRYCISLDWKCSFFSQLRVDADGALMICNDIRGETAEKYNIINIDEESYRRFIEDWQDSRSRNDCPGCYWSVFPKAEEYLLSGRLEFDYVL